MTATERCASSRCPAATNVADEGPTEFWRCSAPEPVRAADTWYCESRNDFDAYQGASTLTKITDPNGDPLCGVLEADLSSPEGATASGTAF